MTLPDDALRSAGWDVYTITNDSADDTPHTVELRYVNHDGCVSLAATMAPDEARALAARLVAEADLADAQDVPPPAQASAQASAQAPVPDPSSCTHDWDVLAWTGLLHEACGRLYLRSQCRTCGLVCESSAPVGARVGARLPGQGDLHTPQPPPSRDPRLKPED